MNRIRQPYSRHTTTTVDQTDIDFRTIRRTIYWLEYNHRRRMELEFSRPYCATEARQLRFLNHRHWEQLQLALYPPRADQQSRLVVAAQRVVEYCLRLTGKHQWA